MPSIPQKSIFACVDEGTIFPPHQELSVSPQSCDKEARSLVGWTDGQPRGPEPL